MYYIIKCTFGLKEIAAVCRTYFVSISVNEKHYILVQISLEYVSISQRNTVLYLDLPWGSGQVWVNI